MDRIKKNFGFGCMRLPMKGREVDTGEFSRMADTFLANGFNYFDTAHGCVGTKSETALRECLTSRHPRDSYVLTDKLTNFCFKKEEDIRPFFQSQLEACGWTILISTSCTPRARRILPCSSAAGPTKRPWS